MSKPDGAPLLKGVNERARPYVVSFVMISGFINLLSLTVPLYILTIFDRVLSSQSVDTLAFLTVIALIAVATHAFLESLRGFLFQRLADWWLSFIGPHILARSIEKRLSQDGLRLEMLREAAQLKNFVSGSTVPALLDLPWLPLFAIISFLIHPLIGIVALIGAAILAITAIIGHYRGRHLVKTSVASAQKELRLGESIMRNAEAIDSMGMGETMLRRWQGALREELALNAEVGQVGTVRKGFSRFFRAAVQIALYGTAAVLVINNEITPGAMIAGSIIAGRLLAPIEGVVNNWRGLTMARESYRRLREFFAGPSARMPATTLPRPKGHLSADRVGVQIIGRPLPILRNISFKLEAGEQMAIMGPAASGKTTLVKTILGSMRPSVGSMRLDGAETHAYDRSEFGQYCGYLPQGVELFEGTVAENICRFTDCDDEDIVFAARVAGCHELILGLPNGYDTQLRDGSPVLSGGQAQQIALARAVFGNPSLVVLDEPNANLDMSGERALRECLIRLRKLNTTVVVVSHRKSLLKVVDKLLVLNQGMVRQIGPVDEVAASLAGKVSERSAALDETLSAGKGTTGSKPAEQDADEIEEGAG